MSVLNTVGNALTKSKLAVRLVAAGLKPVLTGDGNSAQDMDDVSFLQSLYINGLSNVVTIVSVQANDLTGEPLQASDKSEPRVLRHYENIRQVMLDFGHESGLIWITHLTPPDGSIDVGDQQYLNPLSQSAWYEQALSQVKSQLYIGVAFLSGLNPSESEQSISLIQSQGDYHPFYRSLRDLISVNRSDNSSSRPGRAKDQPLIKSIK